jgi:hypothetical protein
MSSPMPRRFPNPTSQLAFAFLIAFAVGCGGSGGGAGPCDGDSPDPACETECDGDGDCPSGFSCGADDLCTAECTQSGAGCGSGQVCDERGQCVPGNDQVDASTVDGCPSVAVDLAPRTPTVILLVDRSGSMTQDFDDDLDRWDAVQQALADPDEGVVTELQSDVRFGVTLYNSEGGGSVPDECPILHSVAPDFGNAGSISDLFSDYDPSADTPTAESVQAVAAAFPESDGPRIIVLATDGDPDRCDDHDAHDEQSQQFSEEAVQGAYESGIETFVLSVGDQVSEPHLQRLANAGQGEPLDTGEQPFYVANDQQELIESLRTILTGARTCEIDVSGSVDLARADEGRVVLNGDQLEYDVDWRMIDNTTLELLGDACTTFLETPEVNLQASFPCGIVID